MRTFKLGLQYLGTRYLGWQVQPQGPTVQGILQDILSQTLQEPITVIGAGRTDSGVHALGQVAHFRTHHAMDLPTLHKALNAQLPEDIAVWNLEEVDERFHAQRDAVHKIYCYLMLNSVKPSPFFSPFSWRQYGSLDWETVEDVLETLVGTHDFRAFCAADSHVKSTQRKLLAARLTRLPLGQLGQGLLGLGGILDLVSTGLDRDSFHELEAGELAVLTFQGEGFLKHMIRNLVGTLRDVAQGKTSAEEFSRILQSRDRRLAGMTAPPQGLFLLRVAYP